ncbi:MAG: S1 RNA-binding domain-containing protein [Leptospirales bacterium]|nr:S1 RNA-binding domain-containing protein [Leptospirales bacterium]
MDYKNGNFNESIDMESVANLAHDEIRSGVVIEGEVVTVDDNYVYVSVGIKSDGRILLGEFASKPVVGQKLQVMLRGQRRIEGVCDFSIKDAEKELGWQKFIRDYDEQNGEISGKVVSATSKGKFVECAGGQRAFLPFSLSADLKNETQSEVEYRFKVKNVDRKKRSVVVSRKDYLDEENRKKWSNFILNHKVGDTVEGEVIKFVEFGAFVRADGIDALIHRNDMSWKNVFKQRKILKLGEKRPFLILSVNEADKKVSLGIKQFADDPWSKIEERVTIGSVLEGVVVTVVNTGAFIEINDEIDGFLPNTEFSWSHSGQFVKNALKKGDTFNVKVIDIDKNERKLLLSRKQAGPNPWDTIAEKFPVGSVHKSKIKKVVKFGLFVELEEGIEGLVHISDISWENSQPSVLNKYSVDEEVEFKILEIKKSEMKISCGIKQLGKSAWEISSEKYKPKMRVKGTVSGVMKFGVFVKIDENLEGLVHISEIPKHKIDSLNEAYKVGDQVEAVLLNIDQKKRRISLSIKQFEYASERDELNKVLRETGSSSNTVTIGDMVNIKLNG